MPLSKCSFENDEIEINTLTEKQFKIMFLCFKHGGTIDFKRQSVYSNQISFYNSMLDLIRQKAIEENNLHEYRLTSNGVRFVKNVILK